MYTFHLFLFFNNFYSDFGNSCVMILEILVLFMISSLCCIALASSWLFQYDFRHFSSKVNDNVCMSVVNLSSSLSKLLMIPSRGSSRSTKPATVLSSKTKPPCFAYLLAASIFITYPSSHISSSYFILLNLTS